MVSIEIDGKKIEAEQGSMIIEVADAHGITIPRFCYHKKLSIAANCRMCLVEVDGGRKPLPACATPISDGMVINTQSEFAQDSQKSVMEFLLINHPLDCPICDQGGECELQDVALEYGKDVSRFSEKKRAVVDEDIGPLIETEMTRCIHCTRCVRFGREIAGIRELGAVGRGEHMEISTFIEQSVDSEVSGNIIDLCPVGALTAKPSRYQARAWEMTQHDSVSPHDCIGANLHVHTLRDRVIRVVPKDNEAVNEVWLADRDRYSYEAIDKSKRLLKPMLKHNGEWKETDWESALERTASKLNMMVQTDGANQIAAIAHPSSTTEEMYLLQKVIRGLGSNNIDHRLRITDFSCQQFEPLHPELGIELSQLENLDAALLIGANLRKEQPLVSLRLRKATRFGRVASVGLYPVYHNFSLSHEILADAETWLIQLAGITKYLYQHQPDTNKEQWADTMDIEGLEELLSPVKISQEHREIGEMLLQGEHSSIILGATALEFSYAGQIRLMAKAIANLSGSTYGFLPHGGNSVGAYLAGAVPHRGPAGADVEQDGQHIKDIFEQGKKGFILLKTEPGKESVIAKEAKQSLHNADFVVSLTCHADDEAFEYADVILPIASFLESSGSYVNVNGRWQDFSASINAPGEAKPAWKVLRVLGNLLNLKNFEYVSATEVRKEVKGRLSAVGDRIKPKWQCPERLPRDGYSPRPVNMYQIDGWLRRAPSLQETALAKGQEILKRPRLSPFHNIVGGI